ncbi:hypothetical protein CAPTEDRAFT_215461 [Capitella teleta]|uniref:SUEL-type lectin domain-containing protein n=1 Tax=Capitella teleta TaxID=283909 RepID=R7TZS1_CAPTE|nr:hypothetical protein CAPTEDRAFT_215461 [Capitella teleta]|eukprot:ELT99127.1 hypothetical protein CAPTEDRAFT_215461 [Capitella teleta]
MHTLWILITVFAFTRANKYCPGEDMSAKCLNNEVIMMMDARLVQGQIGACRTDEIVTDVDTCSVDVIGIIDVKCSAFQVCSVPVSNVINANQNTCHEIEDHELFLEASYQCVKAIGFQGNTCPMVVDLTSNEPKYLANTKLTTTSQRATSCPWRIKADRGKHINMTLWDFGFASTDDHSTVCSLYAIVVRQSGDLTVCKGLTRQRHVTLVQNDTLDLYVLSPRSQSIGFLLEFSEVGCPRIRDNPEYQNVSQNNSIVIIQCTTGENKMLECVDQKWVGETCINIGTRARGVGFLIVILMGIFE